MNAAQAELNEERFFNGFSLEWLEAWRFFLSGTPDIAREKWQLILELYPEDLDVQVGIDLLNPKEHENESSTEEVKCYWRLGQSLRYLQRFSDAAEVYDWNRDHEAVHLEVICTKRPRRCLVTCVESCSSSPERIVHRRTVAMPAFGLASSLAIVQDAGSSLQDQWRALRTRQDSWL